ncbi:unnamed protein product, partial [Porites lobata]
VDNPRGLKENTAMDNIEKANKEDHTENTFKNIFEGDVELTESDREGVDTINTNSTDRAEVDVDSVLTKRKAISSRRHLWVRKVVPVELGPGSSKAWRNILKAVQEIQKKSCVRFRMKKKGDENWIRFVKKNGCFSPVGRQYLKKGMQELSIGKGCNSKGIILHELMHALGFWHEQSRSDRQSYLEVLWENINPGQIHNFNRYKKKNLDFFGGSYDFSSIMHYGNYAFSKNKRPTMLSVKNPLLQFGQIAKLSPTDALQLNALYDCRDCESNLESTWCLTRGKNKGNSTRKLTRAGRYVYERFRLYRKCSGGQFWGWWSHMVIRLYFSALLKLLMPQKNLLRFKVFMKIHPKNVTFPDKKSYELLFVSRRETKKQGWSSWGNWSPCDTNCTKERERFCSADNIKKCPGADRDRIQIQKSKCPNKECYETDLTKNESQTTGEYCKKSMTSDNPGGLKDNTVMDKIEQANEEDHAEKKVKNIFEGDIQLTSSDKDGVDTSNTNSADTAEVDVDSVVTKRKAISSRRHLWVRKVVPVELGPGASRAWNNILKAVDEIQKKSCVKFRMKKDGDEHWIRFVKKSGCNSPVGRQYLKKGMQELSIGDGCNEKGIILHELLHALGFWHEQSRSDRDDYLQVLWENIDPQQLHNFNRYRKKDMDFYGGSYDFSSIMHYGNYAFSKNKRPTMLSVKDPLLQFGQIAKLSPTDILQLNALYDCRTKKKGWSNWGNWSPCDKNCTKERERFCSADDIKKCPGADGDRIELQKAKCPMDECYVPINGHWGRWGPWSKCSRNCGQGYQTQSRTCDDPKPEYGGKYCKGPLVRIRPCMMRKQCK